MALVRDMLSFERAIQDAMNVEFESIIADEVKQAQERLEKRIREHLANVAMTASSFYEMRTRERNLIITVRDTRVDNRP